MKIIQVIPHLGSGGAERFVVDLSNELSHLGHQVVLCTLYALNGAFGFYRKEIDTNIKVVSLNKPFGFSFRTVASFFQLVRKEHPDIIHSHLGALQYSVISQVLQSKGFHTIHNEAHLEVDSSYEKMLRKIIFKFGLVTPITISNESQISFEKYYHKRAIRINNGRNIGNITVSREVKEEIQSYKHNNLTRVIIQLARFQEQKNIPMMARVAKRLSNEGYNFTLLFIGNTDNVQILEEVKKEMPSCAHVLGEKRNPLEYLKEAGAFALSSSFEGMPISLIEALGVGAIPICTPVGGIPDAVINGENGILSRDTSENSYYDAVKSYLEIPNQGLKTMKEKALQSYNRYSMSECAKKYVSAFLAATKN